MANQRRDTSPRKPAPIGGDPAFWAKLSSEFQSLKEEERPRARMFAEGHYVTGSPYCGTWWLRDSPSENFQVRFERVARQAGSALSLPGGVPPLTFWLHKLHNNLHRVFGIALECKMIAKNPVRLEGRPGDSAERGAQPFTGEQLTKLRQAANEDLLAYLLLRWTGLRGSDAVRLTWAEID